MSSVPPHSPHGHISMPFSGPCIPVCIAARFSANRVNGAYILTVRAIILDVFSKEALPYLPSFHFLPAHVFTLGKASHTIFKFEPNLAKVPQRHMGALGTGTFFVQDLF